jgi:hypothetical protein
MMMTAPVKTRDQYVGTPIRMRLFARMTISVMPSAVPVRVPTPPVTRVPPSTTAAMTVSSIPRKVEGSA